MSLPDEYKEAEVNMTALRIKVASKQTGLTTEEIVALDYYSLNEILDEQ